jgi:hypothetical protein
MPLPTLPPSAQLLGKNGTTGLTPFSGIGQAPKAWPIFFHNFLPVPGIDKPISSEDYIADLDRRLF